MNIISSYQFDGASENSSQSLSGGILLVNPPLHDPVLKLRHLGVDPSIGTAGVSEGDNTRQLAHPISIGTDKGTTAIPIAGGVASTAGADHVLGDVAGEDRLAVGCRVQRDLDPLQMVRQEKTSPCGQTPPCRVANRLRRNLGISRLEELYRLHVGIIEVERSADSDKADVVVKGRGVPAPVELHLGDGPGLVIALQVPVVHPGNDPVKHSQLSVAAVSGRDHLVPVHDRAATDVASQRLQRDLPGELVFWSLLAADNPALAKSQVLPKLRLCSHERETDQHEEELHVELRSRAGLPM